MKKIILTASLLSVLIAPAGAGSIHAFNSGMNCNGVRKLPNTNQTYCYSNDATPVAGTCPNGNAGQDGEYQTAVSSPSYTIISDRSVAHSSVTLDNITGLMWITNPATDAGFNNPAYAGDWGTALTSCTVTMNTFNGGKGYAGYTDWRLPNANELMSIVDYGTAATAKINGTYFPACVAGWYFSSTSLPHYPTYKWVVDFTTGQLAANTYSQGGIAHYIRCVRGP